MARRFYITHNYICNNDCLMCGVPKWKRKGNFIKLSNNEFFSLLDSLELKEDDQLIFSGGEPSILNDFLDLCRRIKETYPAELIILSNGRLFADKKFAEEFSEIGVDRVIIPIFSNKSRVHDEITQRAGSFRQTMNGLKNLQKLRVSLGIKFIALKSNYRDAKNVMKIITDEFRSQWMLFCGIQIEGETLTNLEKTAEKYSLVTKEIEKAIDYAETKDYMASIHMMPMCMLDPYYWKNYSVGAYTEEVLAPDKKEIDDNSEKNFEKKPKICNNCLLKNRCVWAWRGYSQVFGLGELKPIE